MSRKTMAAHRVGEISASYTPDKEIGFKYTKKKKLKQGNTKNLNNPTQKRAREKNRKVLKKKKERRTVNKYIKNLRYLALSKIQTKTT